MFWEKTPTNFPSLLKIHPQITAVTTEVAPATKARSVSRNQATSASRGAHSIHTVIIWRLLSTLSSEEATISAGTLEGKWRALGVSLWTLMLEWTSVTFSPAVSRIALWPSWWPGKLIICNFCSKFSFSFFFPRSSGENEEGDSVHPNPQYSHPSYYCLFILLDLHVPQQTEGVRWHSYSPTTHCLTESRNGAAST